VLSRCQNLQGDEQMVRSIDPRRETLRGPHWPKKVAGLSGTRVAETILASVRMRAHQQAGHMDASDLIKSLQRQPCEEGAVHIWGPDADRRAKLLICKAVKGSLLDAYSH
jgi:hypothetical protein